MAMIGRNAATVEASDEPQRIMWGQDEADRPTVRLDRTSAPDPVESAG